MLAVGSIKQETTRSQFSVLHQPARKNGGFLDRPELLSWSDRTGAVSRQSEGLQKYHF